MPRYLYVAVGGILGFSILPVATAMTNLAPNAGFEIQDTAGPRPAEWTFWDMGHGDVALTDEESFDGAHSVKIVLPGRLDAAQGISVKLAVEEKKKYSFSVKVKRGVSSFSAGQGGMKLIIDWQDESGRVLERTEGRELALGSIPKYRWKELEISRTKAPDGAHFAVFGIHCWARGATGVIYLDAAQIMQE